MERKYSLHEIYGQHVQLVFEYISHGNRMCDHKFENQVIEKRIAVLRALCSKLSNKIVPPHSLKIVSFKSSVQCISCKKITSYFCFLIKLKTVCLRLTFHRPCMFTVTRLKTNTLKMIGNTFNIINVLSYLAGNHHAP